MAMGLKATVDVSGLKAFAKRLAEVQKQSDAFFVSCAKGLAARLLSLVIPATPVGRYPAEAGKTGGTLRRGWTAKTHEEAESGKSAQRAGYAYSLKVFKTGGNYVVEVVNPVEYASYVELGHRTANKRGWVPGKFFLTISEEQLKRMTPALLEKRLTKKMREVFGDG